MTQAAITIDVDSLRFYREIHGLRAGEASGGGRAGFVGPSPAEELADDPIYRVALPRFFALLEEMKLPATLFLIGEDAALHREAFAPARKLGCEIASHSFSHDYRLTLRTREQIETDLARAEEVLEAIAGAPVIGFRAPGYNVSPELLECLVARGYRYDSSLLPAPAYWTVRALAISRYALFGRRSRSLVGDARAFSGPLTSYRTTPARPWRRTPRGSLLEIPISCEPATRVPLFGTTWTLLPEPARTALLGRALRKLPCINFELHAIDLLDRSDPGIPTDLARAQLDLRIRWADKERAFRGLLAQLKGHADVVTLRAIARTHE
jgi:peptidoglycan-N-acetylglucosamine deacetylase